MNEELVERYIRTKRKVRKIVTYKEDSCALRTLHENALRFVRGSSYPSLFAKAYIPHRGIFENAKAHLYNDIFIKMDIKDFFNSINHEQLATQLFIELNKVSDVFVSRSNCEKLVEVASCGYPGLPLGLVTSPDLANLYLKAFDSIFYGKIKKMGLNNPIYTRYADDLIVSFKNTEDYEAIAKNIIREAKQLLGSFYLKLNDKKTQITNLNNSNHVRITGVNIVKKENNYRHISVGKKLKNELFWKAIHYYDYPDNASELDVARLKGMLSFIFSIEKEGISYSFSRGMRQLIYDRGFRNIKHLVNSLPRSMPVVEWNYCEATFDCSSKTINIELNAKSNTHKELRVWVKDIKIATPDDRFETHTDYIRVGTLKPAEEGIKEFQIGDNLFRYYYLVPYDAENNPFDIFACCKRLSFTLSADYGEDRNVSTATFEFLTDDFNIVGEFNKDFAPDPNNFKPNDILYIYKGNIKCHIHKHPLIQATAILHSQTAQEIRLNVEYCPYCKKFLLNYTLFEEYRRHYGVLIGNLRMMTNGSFDGEYDLALESPLRLSGYNVGQKDGYTSSERRYILARIIYDGIMRKGEVIRYLSYFIRTNGAKPGNELALSKWREDLQFVQNYNTQTQPQAVISDIRPY